MNNALIIGIVCLLLGFLIGQLIRTIKVKQKNQELEIAEQQIQLRIKDLEKEYIQKNTELDKQYSQLTDKYIADFEEQNQKLEKAARTAQAEITNERIAWDKEKNQKIIYWAQHESNLKSEVSGLEQQIEEKKHLINDLDNQAKTAAKLVEEQVVNNMTIEVEQQSKNLINKYEQLESELLVHYQDLADAQRDEWLITTEKLDNQILEKENQLNNLQQMANAAIESNKRAAADKQQKDFYRLQLDEIDKEEIKRIRSIEPYLRKKEPLNKVIWKVYYEKPCTDLIGRVVGQGRKTGIYKITNIDNGMCYVGQAVDIAERWKQHIKRGIGADPPTQNKLHPAMLAIGVENFMFEIIEECSGNLLNEKEDYWQNFYNAKEWGYSIK